jgi:hypothetical protein
MRWTGPDTLSFELHFGVDIADSDLIDQVQSWLADQGRAFSVDLRVCSYERDRHALRIDPKAPRSLHQAVIAKGTERGATYRALAAVSPPMAERRFGHALVRGKTPATYLKFDFDAQAPFRPSGSQWLFSNTIGGWSARETIGSMSRADWARSLASELARDPRLLWGQASMDSEFRERNLHDAVDGVWALGRDVRLSLPGVFWLNFFGRPYVDLIGKQRILTVPCSRAGELNGNIMVELEVPPEDWSTAEGRECHNGAVAHLGQEFFFDRHKPHQQTAAPDFGLEPLPERKPFQVMTTDGKRFTTVDGPSLPRKM